MPLTIQKRNPEMIDLLSADFQRRYEPNFAWVNACSAIALLPGLRGFWPMSANILTAQSCFVSDPVNNFHLTTVNDPLFKSAGLAPYIDFNGANQYLYYADNAQFDVIGNEAYIQDKGLTLGCWMYLDAWGNVVRPLMTKWQAPGQNAYYLAATGAATQLSFGVSTDGTNIAASATSGAVATPVGAWTFICGRYIPSTSVCVWMNGTKFTTVAGVPATLFNGTSNLEIARGFFAGAYAYLDGRSSLAWLCASALSDTQIFALYQQTRALYGA